MARSVNIASGSVTRISTNSGTALSPNGLSSPTLVDTNGDPIGPNNSLNDLEGTRVDPRFFLFPNGEAGVLLELTGDFYVLTEF